VVRVTVYSYVFVKAVPKFPSELKRRLTAANLHYVNPTSTVWEYFVVLQTNTIDEAEAFVATEFVAAGASISQHAFAQQAPAKPDMLKYAAPRICETFLHVETKEPDKVFEKASDPKGEISGTYIGSAIVRMVAAAPNPYQVIIGLGSADQSAIDVDTATVTGWVEVSNVVIVKRA
jgi:hypothetical protein